MTHSLGQPYQCSGIEKGNGRVPWQIFNTMMNALICMIERVLVNAVIGTRYC